MINVLTESRIRSAAPADKPQRLFDGGGLYLEVSPSGGRWWRLKYRWLRRGVIGDGRLLPASQIGPLGQCGQARYDGLQDRLTVNIHCSITEPSRSRRAGSLDRPLRGHLP